MAKGKGPDAFDVFVSYGREDAKLVNEVVEHLINFDLRIWFDRRSMVYGRLIRDAILDGIRSSSVVLAFISRDSVASQWVREEIDAAMTLETSGAARVVPVFLGRIADQEIPGALRDKYSLDLRYNFRKKWLEERDAFTETIVAFAKGQDFAPRAIARPPQPAPGGAVSPTFRVADLARRYDFPPGLDGTGQCVGVVELGGGYQESDLEAYPTALGLPVPKVTPVSVDGAGNSPADGSGADVQVALDIQVIAAVAPRADIAVYFAPSTDAGFLHAILAAVEDDTRNPGVLCIGWGEAEPSWNRESMLKINEAMAAAAARGITVCCAAGDRGPADGVGDGNAHVDFPASSPHVLACGGTKITAGGNEIEAEVVWNDGSSAGVTGGGFSEVFPVPAWQEDILTSGWPGPGTPGGRGLPDVAANASPQSGYQILVSGRGMVIGGTSAVTPLWAGLLALMNQALGERVGFLNPVLYRNLGPVGILGDITIGSTRGDDPAGLGYQARAGWDPCTGWGVPAGGRLLTALKLLQTTRR